MPAMSTVNFIITRSGVIITDGKLLTDGITNLAGAEAKYGLYQLDNLEPAAAAYLDGQSWLDLAQSMDDGDINNSVKQVLSSIFGGAAGVYALGKLPIIGSIIRVRPYN